MFDNGQFSSCRDPFNVPLLVSDFADCCEWVPQTVSCTFTCKSGRIHYPPYNYSTLPKGWAVDLGKPDQYSALGNTWEAGAGGDGWGALKNWGSPVTRQLGLGSKLKEPRLKVPQVEREAHPGCKGAFFRWRKESKRPRPGTVKGSRGT